MRKITIAAVLLAGLPAAAHAQQGQQPDPYAAQKAAEARDAAIIDKRYRTILELTEKPQPTKVDPWRNMRGAGSADASKPKH